VPGRILLAPLVVDAAKLVDRGGFETRACVDTASELKRSSRVPHRLGVLLGAQNALANANEGWRIVWIDF
jgi:hypothetical protein